MTEDTAGPPRSSLPGLCEHGQEPAVCLLCKPAQEHADSNQAQPEPAAEVNGPEVPTPEPPTPEPQPQQTEADGSAPDVSVKPPEDLAPVVKSMTPRASGVGLATPKLADPDSASEFPSEDGMSADWVELQKKTFTRWVNHHFRKAGFTEMTSLTAGFGDGESFNKLVEVLTHETHKRNKKPKMKVAIIGNINAALQVCMDKGMKLVNVGAEELAGGNTKIILGMCWGLIQHFQMKDKGPQQEQGTEDEKSGKKNTAKLQLLQWVNDTLRSYQGEGFVEVKDFTDSWRDGLALTSLVAALLPVEDREAMLAQIQGKETMEALTRVISVGETKLEVPALLDASDMLSRKLDEHSNMTYISFFKHQQQMKLAAMMASGEAERLRQEAEERLAKAKMEQQAAEAEHLNAMQNKMHAKEQELQDIIAKLEAEIAEAKAQKERDDTAAKEAAEASAARWEQLKQEKEQEIAQLRREKEHEEARLKAERQAVEDRLNKEMAEALMKASSEKATALLQAEGEKNKEVAKERKEKEEAVNKANQEKEEAVAKAIKEKEEASAKAASEKKKLEEAHSEKIANMSREHTEHIKTKEAEKEAMLAAAQAEYHRAVQQGESGVATISGEMAAATAALKAEKAVALQAAEDEKKRLLDDAEALRKKETEQLSAEHAEEKAKLLAEHAAEKARMTEERAAEKAKMQAERKDEQEKWAAERKALQAELAKLRTDHYDMLSNFKSEMWRQHMEGGSSPIAGPIPLIRKESNSLFEVAKTTMLYQQTEEGFTRQLSRRTGLLIKKRREGTITGMGGTRKERYIVLQGTHLEWYDKPEGKKLGSCDLGEYELVAYNDEHKEFIAMQGVRTKLKVDDKDKNFAYTGDQKKFVITLVPRGELTAGRDKTPRRSMVVPGANPRKSIIAGPAVETKKGHAKYMELESVLKDGKIEGASSLSWVEDLNRRIAIADYLSSMFSANNKDVTQGSMGCREIIQFLCDLSLTTLSVVDRASAHTAIHDALMKLREPLSTRAGFEAIELKSVMLHDSTVALLAQIISRNNNIKRVDLSDNVITAEGADQLSLALQINRSVEHMDLSYNRLQDAGLLQISAALPTHPELRSLNLRGNKIGDTGIKGLVDWIMHQDDSNVEFVRKTRGFSISKKEEGGYMPMHTFPRLELSENRIGPDGVKALCKLITYNRSITSLDLHSNMVDDVGAEYLAALIISGYHGLKELSLSQNQISSVGASKLAEAIQACKSELVVDLSGNPLLGREAVAVMLRTGMDLSFEFLKVHLRPGSMPMPVVPSGRSTPDSVSRSLTTRTYSDNFKLSANKIVEEKEEENITPNASPERGFSRPVPLSCKCTHVCVCGGSGVVVPEKAKDMADMSPMISVTAPE